MKVSVSKNGFTLKNISAEELGVVQYILNTVKTRCFGDYDYDEQADIYYDGGDFVASLRKEERSYFIDFVCGLETEIDLLKAKLQDNESISVGV